MGRMSYSGIDLNTVLSGQGKLLPVLLYTFAMEMKLRKAMLYLK